MSLIRNLILASIVALASLLMAAPAQAASCNYATSQGSTGPSDWQTFCWLDLSSYADATARSASGQAFSYTLPDGSKMTFTLKVSGSAIFASTAPSWTGGAVGNTAFLGISGSPILYQSAAGTTTAVFSNIVVTPPAGSSGATTFMFVAGDGESSNETESLSFQSNGGAWQMLDQAGPISGAAYPTYSGIGTSTFTESGVAGTVGAYIVGSSIPTQVTTTLVGGGLQGAMFAVRFASIRLNLQITGARAAPADQFKFDIAATTGGAILATGTSSGTALGPYTAAALSSASAIGITLQQALASGSTSTASHYRTTLTCTNSTTSSTTPMPNGVVASSYNFGSLSYGDAVQCVFTETPYPHLILAKALGTGGRQFNTDQFTLNIDQGTTNVATATTNGTASTLTVSSTPQVQVTAGSAYKLSEVAAGTSVLAQYVATMACSNSNASSTTTLPGTPGGSVTMQMGDVIACTITNTKRASNAQLTVIKDMTLVSDPANGASNPKAIPGAILRYTFTVANTGPAAVDNNTVFVIDLLPSQLAVGSSSTPLFAQGAVTSGLTFAAGTDIKYSNSATSPTSFAGCTYAPVSAYDPAVRFVCLNPKGIMAGSTGTPPSFTLSIQAKLN